MMDTINMSPQERAEFLRLRSEQKRFEAELGEHKAKLQLCELRLTVVNREQDAWMMEFAFSRGLDSSWIKNLKFNPEAGLVKVVCP